MFQTIAVKTHNIYKPFSVCVFHLLHFIEKKGIHQPSNVNVCTECVAPVAAPLWRGIVWLPAV